MKKLARCLLVALMLLCLTYPVAAMADVLYEYLPECYRYVTPGEARVITGARVAVYDGSQPSAQLISSITANETVTVVHVENSRAYIYCATLPNGGWVPVTSLVNTGVLRGGMFVNNPNEGKRVNLRAQPDENSQQLGAYYTGTVVYPVSGVPVENKYQMVRIGDQIGYMHTNYIRTGNLTRQSDLPYLNVYDPWSTGVTMRNRPETYAEQIKHIRNGSLVTVLGIRYDGWYHVMFEGDIGYVEASKLSQLLNHDGTLLNPGSNITNPSRLYVHSSKPGNRVNLRTQPYKDAISLAKYYTGTEIIRLEEPVDGYMRVRIGHVEGYMDVNFITSDLYSFESDIREGFVTNVNGTDLRRWNTDDSAVLGHIPYGHQVTVIGLASKWVHILDGETHAFVLKDDIYFVP